MNFNVQVRSGQSMARAGVLNLSRGTVQTPYFMSIGTLGTVKGLTVWDLAKLDCDILLSNTYHTWLRPGLDVIEDACGLHNFINWQKPILTDSGGFQAFSLSKIRKFTEEGVFFTSQLDGQKRFLSPEISMGIQTILGSDVALVLDECLEAEVTENEAKQAMLRTRRWAERCQVAFQKMKLNPPKNWNLEQLEKAQGVFSSGKTKLQRVSSKSLKGKQAYQKFLSENNFVTNFEELEFKLASDQLLREKADVGDLRSSDDHFQARQLWGIPQGAQFINLRKESARLTMELNFPGYSIGGVANGGEPEEIMYNQVVAQTEILEPEKPRHLLGVGTPKDIIEMVKRGIDLFDCVYPTRNARHGSLFIWENQSDLQYENIKIESQRFAKDFSVIKADSKFPELQHYTKAYLRHLFKCHDPLALRLATLNNLEFYYDLMRILRQMILQNQV